MDDPYYWELIVFKLAEEGFKVSWRRVRDGRDRRLWSAEAIRNGRQWTAAAENVNTAFIELERETREAVEVS